MYYLKKFHQHRSSGGNYGILKKIGIMVFWTKLVQWGELWHFEVLKNSSYFSFGWLRLAGIPRKNVLTKKIPPKSVQWGELWHFENNRSYGILNKIGHFEKMGIMAFWSFLKF